MKMRWILRLAIALILAVAVPACHHSTRPSTPPPEKQDPNAPTQKP